MNGSSVAATSAPTPWPRSSITKKNRPTERKPESSPQHEQPTSYTTSWDLTRKTYTTWLWSVPGTFVLATTLWSFSFTRPMTVEYRVSPRATCRAYAQGAEVFKG